MGFKWGFEEQVCFLKMRSESSTKGIIKTDDKEAEGKQLGAQKVTATENSRKEEMEHKPGEVI